MDGVIPAEKIINKSICAPGIECVGCFSDEAIREMKSVSDADYQKAVSSAIMNGDRESQLKLLYDDKTLAALGDDMYASEFSKRFKSHTPQGNKLFSNYNLNLVLSQLHDIEPTFMNFDCELMDFYNHPDSPLSKSLNKNSALLQGIRSGETLTFGTVPNTLVSTGDTSRVGHWVALFGDFRGKKFTIEYYNSSGNNAPAKFFAWMQSLAKLISDETNCDCIALNVSNIASQKGPSECGIYSLHYIISRLVGIPYKSFREHKISDNDVNKIRKLFLNEAEVKGRIKEVLRNRGLI
jgi:hypothetical protein